MIIRVPKNYKDLIDKKPHKTMSRRDFIARGLATTTATAMLPHGLMAAIAKQAYAATSCPAASRTPGCIGALMREGGPTVGAMFLNMQQMNSMNTTMAANYGITGTANLVQFGSNWGGDSTSPFMAALTTAPAGWVGGQAAWSALLKNTSLSGNWGPHSADDGAGQNAGHLGGAGSFKTSQIGKDLVVNPNVSFAPWAQALGRTSVNTSPNSLTSAKVAANYGMTPTGMTNSQLLTNSAMAADSLSQIFASMFNGGRTNAQSTITAASCGFQGDAPMASATFGTSLFDPTQITALTSALTVASLSAEQQAFLAAFYESAVGAIGVVSGVQNGQDYHNQSVQNSIAPSDFEAGQIAQMWLAGCAAAKEPGCMIFTANGQAIANGTQAVTVNGVNVNGPSAQGDAGGSYNGGFILAYGPTGAPSLKPFTGTLNTTSGNVTASPNVPSVPSSVAGLYLTALTYLGFSPAQFIAFLSSQGINNPASLALI